MSKPRFRWRDLATITFAVALAWGLRGQHGHERGGALAGAMAGLALAAATGGPRWMGAAVLGSFGFALGGALSYGRFMEPAFRGSWEAIRSLALIGFVWGGVGSLALGLGLGLARYRFWERIAIAVWLFLTWFAVDQVLWSQMSGPEDLKTREVMAAALLGSWGILVAYVGVWRKDHACVKLAVAGAIGFAVGFPLAAWVQGAGQASGLPLDWWRTAEHVIGFCGGLSLGLAVFSMEPVWALPLAVRPLERWFALVWLIWLIPSWLIANNLDYWIIELAFLPVYTAKWIWTGLILFLASLAFWAWLEVRRGRLFVVSWMPRHLRVLFLAFLWVTTVIASSKTLVVGTWNFTPLIFLVLAVLTTLTVRKTRV